MKPLPPRPLVAAVLAALMASTALSGCASTGGTPGVLRLGYFPNLTHAQALYGVQSGLYQRTMGDTKLELTTFNAGPAAFEALLSGSVDVIYVGPSPTLNALEHTGDQVVRIVAGSAMGGASLVLRQGVTIDKDSDLEGKRFATPQLGNTQDIALKHWLLGKGQKSSDVGGKVEIVNAQNADILSMFQTSQIDGAWVPEPWATRLVREGHGTVKVDEAELWPKGEFITTQLVTTTDFLASHPTEIAKLLDAHVAATKILQKPDADTEKTINDAVQNITGKSLGIETLHEALGHVHFSTEPLQPAMATLSQWSRDLGFSETTPDLAKAYDLGPLNAALARAGLA